MCYNRTMTNLTVLLIDDLRSFNEKVQSIYSNAQIVVTRNSREALDYLKNNTLVEFDSIWLDHDLGIDDDFNKDTIMPIIDFLNEQAFIGSPINVGTIYVHTSNPVGGSQMMTALQRYNYNAVRVSAPDFFSV